MHRVREAARNPRAALFRAVARTGDERLLRAVTARPVTFNDKLRYKMVRDRRPLVADFADKVAAKAYVARTVGPRYAIEPLAVFDDARDLSLEGLPRELVIKVSHASGGVVFVRDDAPADARLPLPGGPHTTHSVRPDAFDVGPARDVFGAWARRPYGVEKGEWAYGARPPRVLVEPLLRSDEGELPHDVKLYVANGRCVAFRMDDRLADGRMTSNHYLRDGTPVIVRAALYHGGFYPIARPPLTPPDSLGEMIEVAERLGTETDFVRVDLLRVGERFRVGELTNYPASGTCVFRPLAFDRWLGRQWTLPDRYG